ncbi:unnamed protein product [Chondrus crispus]|uniref:MICOS complex subunit MIC60 n=1 Tax=Chondrus crispus TaxID=2769 RepID=R7QRA6_CHOCR|nr:unnamed protein product [Chondrus crispus]CDF39991.1 unnamed protein product [Chondrus crispus]|eukprot:XP_005710285.1 unnamed protein product [Chondrus crispus]
MQGDAKRDVLAKPTTNQEAPPKVSPVQDLDTVGDGPIHKALPKAKPASKGLKTSEDAAIGAASDAKSAGDGPAPLDIIMNFSDDDNESARGSRTGRGAGRGGTSGKEKLARLLGKGDFQADKVEGPDVVDDSVYRKPNNAKLLGRQESRKPWKFEGKRTPSPGTPRIGAKPAEEDPVAVEMNALRLELESQMKWEGVRLQEAVRAQMVADKTIAAREAAEFAKKHSEELTRVREDAITSADKMLREKSIELQAKADAQRDSDVARLIKVKEEEIRETLTLEYADKERKNVVERKKALASAKAQVAALNDQFDSVVAQTERAKEAAKRTSIAFLLRESILASRPLASQVTEAAGRTELGKLVAESVPTAAVMAGVSSIDALKEDFRDASKRGLSVAMVPPGKTGTLWGHFLGALFSRLKIPIDRWDNTSNAPLSSNEERIRRAERLVSDGDLSNAILILDSLNGLSADIMKDWIGAAKARVAADLAAEVLLADAIITQVSLTQGKQGVKKPICC